MLTITPAMSLQTRLFGPVLIGIPLLLILNSPVAWSWRLPAAVSSLLWGWWLWRRYLQRRPLALNIGARGELSFTCADNRTRPVSRVLPGLLHRDLILVRLETDFGESRDLLVPGDALSPDQNWRLRRALVGFRPHQSESRRGT